MEGRRSEGGEHEAQPNVVRLPRDWLGPRDELVPFGPRVGTPTDERPTSAADFWGEQSAAIHDALQAPDQDWEPADAARRSVEPGEKHAAPATIGRFAALRARLRPGAMPRRAVLGAATGLPVAVAIVVVFASHAVSLGGARHPAPWASRISAAAVLSSGLAQISNPGLWNHASAVAPRRSRTARRPPRRPPAPKPRHPAAARTRRTTSSRPASEPVAQPTTYHETVSGTSEAQRPESVSAPVSPSHRLVRSAGPSSPSQASSARATVGPTGESGALGPIKSPNG